MRVLMPLFIVVPLIEIGLFILSGKYIGLWGTLGIVILTGVLGASRAKKEGLAVLRRIQNQLSLGRLPGDELIEGLLVLIGGILLLTPGYLTDLTGLVLMIPKSRKQLVKRIRAMFKNRLKKGQFSFYFKR